MNSMVSISHIACTGVKKDHPSHMKAVPVKFGIMADGRRSGGISKMIRVAIVEDDPDWLILMTDFLNRETDIKVVATASTKEDAIILAEQSPDIHVVLMDINLSDNLCDGINAALHFYENTDAKVVMLTAYSEKELIRNAFTAGACNYISKENYREIPTTIRSAYKGPNPMDVLLEEYRMMREMNLVKELTPSEREVLSLARDGLTRTQIQTKLYKSENTIKTQVSSILKKLQVGSLQDAVKRIRNRGVQ